MSMTKQQITAILAELDADLRKGAEEAEAILRKAAEEDPESESVESKSSEGSNAPSMDATSPDAGSMPPEGASAPGLEGAAPEGASPDAGSMPPEGGEGQDPAAEGGLTPEALQAEYAQLPPEELEMHLQAALAAKEALAGASGGAPGGAPPDASAGGMPPAGPAGGPPAPMMGKGAKQMSVPPQTGGQVTKAEQDLTAMIKSQQEDIENLTKAMSTLLEAPVRKSVAALSDVAPVKKSEGTSMTRKDVDVFIKENAARMTKSERDLWLQYVDNKVPAAKLVPMLERLSSK